MDEQKRAALRKLWRTYFNACDKIHEAYERKREASDVWISPPTSPPFPEELRGLTCGAKTRAGTPCKRKDLYRSGRCKLHGGLSTGPTTDEGKRKAAMNGCRGKPHER
jgi:hypothetical protein